MKTFPCMQITAEQDMKRLDPEFSACQRLSTFDKLFCLLRQD